MNLFSSTKSQVVSPTPKRFIVSSEAISIQVKMSVRIQDILVEGQQVRHWVDSADRAERSTWVATFTNGAIVWRGRNYYAPSTFARDHYRVFRPDRTDAVNGWLEVEALVDGEWITLNRLRGY
jgi:hypothetical protein